MCTTNSCLFQDLTLAQKAGQLLMVSFPGLEFNEQTRKLFEIAHIGHVILYADNVESPSQVQSLCGRLRKAASDDSPIKLNIAIDQEGARVSRLKGGGFTLFPANRSVTQTGDINFAKRCARALAEEMRAVGITMNLAPVCDVNTNPLNPVIGLRSFGEDPDTVTRFAAEAITGYHETGILTCLKHVPGHGDTSVDSHYGLPTVTKDAETLERVEFAPFKNLAAFTDAMMTAHVVFPAFDKKLCATFSKPILDKLRETGFQKLIISDSITMKGALQQTGGDVVEAALLALEAGCDVLCVGGASLETQIVLDVHQGILNAIQTGRLLLSRVEESLKRICEAKARFPEYPLTDLGISEAVGTLKHRALVREIAERSFEVIRRSPSCSIRDKKIFVFYSSAVKVELENTTLFKNRVVDIMTDSDEDIASISSKKIKQADLSIWVVHNAFINAKLQSALASLAARKSPIVLMTVGSTHDSTFFSSFINIETIVNTYSPTRDAMQVALESLQNI